MSATPKWYCRKTRTGTFDDIHRLAFELRVATKRIMIDVKMNTFNEHSPIIKVCERVMEQYWIIKDGSKDEELEALRKKSKRDPYNGLLIIKFEMLMEVADRHFCQLVFVLKKALTQLLKKANESEEYMNWAFIMAQLYNKSQKSKKNAPPKEEPKKTSEETKKDTLTEQAEELLKESKNEFNPNICSNMYPELLLPFKPIDFSYIMQNISQVRIEQNSLDLLLGLLNIEQQNPFTGNGESNSSSMEAFRILTENLAADHEFVQRYATAPTTPVSQRRTSAGVVDSGDEAKSLKSVSTYYDKPKQNSDLNRVLRLKHVEEFIQKERDYIANLIEKANAICPTVFGSKYDLETWAARAMRQMWSYMGMILDHIILWWIDTPLCCYPLSHVDAIRNWLLSPCITELPEPVSSTLRGVGEILTNYVCNIGWDQLIRLTLIANDCAPGVIDKNLEQFKGTVKNDLGTPAGRAWVNVFSHLINLSNDFFPDVEVQNTSLIPVSEQIPILHRIDHSIHSMRLWVKEQAKLYCSEWKMNEFFQILEHDVKITLELFSTLRLPKLTADLDDVLLLVCVALRTKLIFEINTNLEKLKKTSAECIDTLSSVCRVTSLANFALCFPAPHHWQQSVYGEEQNSAYVDYVLDQIFLPTIKATKDIVILKLILKIICESWLDFIYKKRIKFTPNGALRLLNDFDEVREWILRCTLLDEEQLRTLSCHEVLRMCKGVGKILLRKPEDVISITQSPKYDKKSAETSSTAQDTQLPSEMFVSNQKNWLQLRASKSKFGLFKLCCDDSAL